MSGKGMAVAVGFLSAVLLAGATPAAAEFFGCNDKSARSARTAYTARAQVRSHAHTQEFAAQSRTRITVYPRRTQPGPNSKRHCRAQLVKEYRASGTVIVPKMNCWWE
ncbi:MAG: hypothetical protein Q8M26_13725 [Pseudolabrys sp.]|nr:hypothetical protein [Pseudolabrys sp.]